MKNHPIPSENAGRRLLWMSLIPMGMMTQGAWGAVTNIIGSYNNWPTTWQAVPGSQDANNGIAPELDFVGDASNPMLYYADNGAYVFCRMRVDLDTYTPPSGAHLWLIDVVGQGNVGIDAAFSWDSKSNDNAKHGLEMNVPSINGPTWGAAQVGDEDGNAGQKLTNDINGGGRTTDGYIRVTDGQTTINFGNTSFIDFAVSWNYLETNTILRKTQAWQVNVASISNATDHNAFNADIGGANLTDSSTIGWSSPIPEPSRVLYLGMTCGIGLFYRRRA